MSSALMHQTPVRARYAALNPYPVGCHLGLLQTKLYHQSEKAPSHLSLPVFSPWDGTNITYGRHHAVTEWLSLPSTNNSVAMGLIKRNGTNYGPIPARAIMYCSALVCPQQPVQTSREWWGGGDWEWPSFPAITSQALRGSKLWWRWGTHREIVQRE